MARSNPLIALTQPKDDPFSGFVRGTNIAARNDALKADAELRRQTADQRGEQFDIAKQDREAAAEAARNQARGEQYAVHLQVMRDMYDRGDQAGLVGYLDARRNGMPKGMSTAETDQFISAINSGQPGEFERLLRNEIIEAQQFGFMQEPEQGGPGSGPKVIGNRLVGADGTVLFDGGDTEEIMTDRNGVPRFSTGPRQGQVVPGFDVEEEPSPTEQIAIDKAEREEQERQEGEQRATEERQRLSDTASGLLANWEVTKRVYGGAEGRLPTVRQGTLDAEADIDFLISNLSLEAREKMKGTGQISDFESRLLGASQTVLQNKLISDARARKEIERVARVFNGEVTEAPIEALRALQQNPDKIEEFEAKYGYVPPGY